MNKNMITALCLMFVVATVSPQLHAMIKNQHLKHGLLAATGYIVSGYVLKKLEGHSSIHDPVKIVFKDLTSFLTKNAQTKQQSEAGANPSESSFERARKLEEELEKNQRAYEAHIRARSRRSIVIGALAGIQGASLGIGSYSVMCFVRKLLHV